MGCFFSCRNLLGLVVYAFFRQTFACFERPTLWGWQFYYAPRQRWRCTSTLPYQKTNPDGVICERKCAIVDDFRRANVSLIFIYVKGNTKLNRQNYTLKNNPLGLVLWQGRVKMQSGLTLPKSSAKCNPLGLVFIYDCISPIIYANKSICQSSPPQNNPLWLVVYAFFRRALGRFERPTLRDWQLYYVPRQRWRCTSTLPYQRTNLDGVIGGRNYAETIQIHAEILTRIRVIDPK